MPMLPERYTMPLNVRAWLNCGSGLGALAVRITWGLEGILMI